MESTGLQWFKNKLKHHHSLGFRSRPTCLQNLQALFSRIFTVYSFIVTFSLYSRDKPIKILSLKQYIPSSPSSNSNPRTPFKPVVLANSTRCPFTPQTLSSLNRNFEFKPKHATTVLSFMLKISQIALNDLFSNRTPFLWHYCIKSGKKFCRWICRVLKLMTSKCLLPTLIVRFLAFYAMKTGADCLKSSGFICSQHSTSQICFDFLTHSLYFLNDTQVRMRCCSRSENQQWKGSQQPGAISLVHISKTFFSFDFGILSAYTVTLIPLSAHSKAVNKPIMPEPNTATFLSREALEANYADSSPQAGAREIPAPPCPQLQIMFLFLNFQSSNLIPPFRKGRIPTSTLLFNLGLSSGKLVSQTIFSFFWFIGY